MVFLTCLYSTSSEATIKQGPESALDDFHVTPCAETRGERGEAARGLEKDSRAKGYSCISAHRTSRSKKRGGRDTL